MLLLLACSTPETTEAGVGSVPAVVDTGGEAGSRCAVQRRVLRCEHETLVLETGLTGLAPRETHFQVPLGEAPEEGWPAVMLLQGSVFSAETFWLVLDTEVLGYWNQGQVTKTLLDNGYAVITPEAHAGGFTAWETNIPPMSWDWESSAVHAFMLDLFEALDEGAFGEIDPDRLYAGGISSGGYMSSRVGIEYPERFRALAVHSGSYMTCTNVLCDVPEVLASDHPPTLFLHGADDVVVPMFTMEDYHQALREQGIGTDVEIQEGVGHAWIDAAPEAMLDWFEAR